MAFQLQIDRLPLAYILFDANLRVLDWNPAAERVFGYVREEVLGQPLLELIGQRPLETRVQDVLRRVQAGEAEAHRIDENRTKEGRSIVCEWFNTPVVDEDGLPRVISLARDITERKREDDALRVSAERLKKLSRRLLEVQEEERQRLARELHDEFGQVLAALALHLHAAKKLAGDAALPQLEACAAVLQRAGEQVRSLAFELRPPLLDTLGLEATLRWLAKRHQERTGCDTQLLVSLSGTSLSPELATACFRVTQEALTNIARHASAGHASIELKEGPQALELLVRDDGMGFDVLPTRELAAQRNRLGLLGMRERAEILGGTLNVESKPGSGTRIHVSFPLRGLAAGQATPEE